jgi:CDP-diacylglycerol--glycerol-3-phosphate 3-phosphatidyltransferase
MSRSDDYSSALMTPANMITVTRLLLAPVLIVAVVEIGPSWGVFLLGAALGLTDALDGYIARRQQPSRFGAFLDPLADKVLVLGTMVALVARGQFHWFPVAVIGVRELAVSLYRVQAGRRGVIVPARPLAKAKTFVQSWAAGLALAPPVAEDAAWIATAVLWVAVVLTIVSGAQYLLDAQRVAADQMQDQR